MFWLCILAHITAVGFSYLLTLCRRNAKEHRGRHGALGFYGLMTHARQRSRQNASSTIIMQRLFSIKSPYEAGTSTSIFSPKPTPLGNFSVLPLEIRLMIWSYLIAGPRITRTKRHPRKLLDRIRSRRRCPLMSALRTSHAICEEISLELYLGGPLFYVHPRIDELNLKASYWWKNHKISQTDLSRFRQIEVWIEAPDPADFRQFMFVKSQIQELVSMVVDCQGKKPTNIRKEGQQLDHTQLKPLGCIMINFLNGRNQWFDMKTNARGLRQAIPYTHDGYASDIELLINLFTRIKNVCAVHFGLPFPLQELLSYWQGERIRQEMHAVKQIMKSPCPTDAAKTDEHDRHRLWTRLRTKFLPRRHSGVGARTAPPADARLAWRWDVLGKSPYDWGEGSS